MAIKIKTFLFFQNMTDSFKLGTLMHNSHLKMAPANFYRDDRSSRLLHYSDNQDLYKNPFMTIAVVKDVGIHDNLVVHHMKYEHVGTYTNYVDGNTDSNVYGSFYFLFWCKDDNKWEVRFCNILILGCFD